MGRAWNPIHPVSWDRRKLGQGLPELQCKCKISLAGFGSSHLALKSEKDCGGASVNTCCSSCCSSSFPWWHVPVTLRWQWEQAGDSLKQQAPGLVRNLYQKSRWGAIEEHSRKLLRPTYVHTHTHVATHASTHCTHLPGQEKTEKITVCCYANEHHRSATRCSLLLLESHGRQGAAGPSVAWEESFWLETRRSKFQVWLPPCAHCIHTTPASENHMYRSGANSNVLKIL